MDTDNTVLSHYKKHVKKINEELEKGLSSRVDLIRDIGNHTLLGHGKRLRPLLFVLSCRLCSNYGEEAYRLSTIFEYVHTASLLHDDVLDNAEIRRNKPSVNHVWGNHAAILEGDFLSSKASSIAVGSNSSLLLKKLTDTSMQMVEGQILELSYTHNWNISKEEYMGIITAKTAVLISAACACGAIISGAEADVEESLERFGLNMGIAFQLMDDLLDYTSSKEVFGKPVGKDLKEGKITLPLIYTLLSLEESERKRLESLLKSQRAAEEDYRNLIEIVRSNGALDQIRDEAQTYVNKAAGYLSSFPDSPAKESLLELNQYIIKRKY
ncbi:MAG: polyprenyl synthetase family protein [Deltaproteobacteria bacterium]|nr:polyprenyl synthetase family protein [Deltaproteobacteria bacterium]MBW1909462.1 polyprenyl synthetase family protein [Deltaproteobacteria bacterium]MBW2034434.1 polyprenyl synthetase family protein [Deltaproteobacteria bacterium]MBW2114712.1 polyprenyl synthetase family protein [Deltaproteobacteria bacterium]MBW2168135.1 polyprenyl synthetase family protein [Deltaproteobacteria bacterium]